ncbi:chain length determinant protein [Novosphingobium nitrogenifigens DSM 19370]|uniref:Chain length determinant protein n=1 Tax=Novosphingobium nitrogenifigens DSM 19370 TaxID=983920 RepID=F1Z530_9SPHN|nr:hypothetical protein [Novosphingobium nitrogenifigens]EGD59995.1 chain length determinant protein [Novosphingobium nitrogenifigens DSM 19370]
MNAWHWLLVIRAQRAIVLVTMLGVLAGAVAMLSTQSKTYLARARVVIDLSVDPVTGARIDPRMFSSVVWTQVNLIKDPAVLIEAAKRLQYLPAEDPNPRDAAAAKLRNQMIRVIDRTVFVDADPDSNSNLMDIVGYGSSPDEAAKIASTVRDAYIDLSVRMHREDAERALVVMRSQLDHLLQERMEAAAERTAFEKRYNVVLADDGADEFNDLLRKVARMDDRSLARMNQSRAGAQPQGQSVQLARIDAQIAMAQTVYGPNNPVVQSLVQQRNALQQQPANTQPSLAMPVATSTSVMTMQVEKLLAQRGVLSEGRMLVLREFSLDDVIHGLATRMVTTAQQVNSATGSVSKSGAAVVFPDPVGPKVGLVLAVATVLGLVLGCQVALIYEFLNRRVRGPGDLAQCEAATLVAIGSR